MKLFLRDDAVGGIDPDADAKSLVISAGIMAVMGSYWLYKRYKFDDKEFNDPFKFNR